MAKADVNVSSTTSDEWTTIDEGSRLRIAFDTVGDIFEGTYEGSETVEFANGENGDYLNFRGAVPDAVKGEPCAISSTYQLARTFTNVAPGTYCRIILRSETPVSKGNPLKNFVVQTRK